MRVRACVCVCAFVCEWEEGVGERKRTNGFY